MFSYKDKNILIVDDQKTFHVILKTMLVNQGANNINFSDSIESAIKLARRTKFDIYLIDYNLGSEKDGAQLIDYLRNNQLIPNSALCFIITGDNDKGAVLSAIERSPDDYLMKPFSQTQLFNRLSKASQKKQVLSGILDALQKKDYPLAITLCKEKIKTEAQFRGLCKNLLADIFIQAGQFNAAEKILKPLIEARPLIRASISLGRAYYLQNKYSAAIKLLNTVIENAPLQIEAYQWLARAYQKKGELKKALDILTLAANMTHHSIPRHQEVALLAREMDEYKIMLTRYALILQLSRNSFYPNPCHLANYIRSIIDYALQQKEIDERKTILKKVNSALYQGHFEEGQDNTFDFNNFEHICQAKVLFALNEPLKAKRKIFNTLHKVDKPIIEFDNTLLCETLFSLLDIGEFDDASPYLHELKQRDILDVTTQAAINKQTGEALESRIHNFKSQNKLGIQAFSQKAYDLALGYFNEALKLEPLNSGALLNRIQVYIQLLNLNKDKNRRTLLNNCESSFELLSHMSLPEEHNKRYHALKNELVQSRKHK